VIFLYPLALFGLAAAAIPAVLHLFQRRSPPEAEFPALRYLSEAERRNASRLRLRHLLLLLLRTALIMSLVVAAARPLVPTRTPGAGHPPTALALVLDNSLSSGAIAGGQVTLDRLKAGVRSVLLRATPDDRLWLVLADGIARAGSREALLAAVDSTGVNPRRLDLVAVVSRAARLVAAEPTPEHAVLVASDLQRTALGDGRALVPKDVRVTALAPGQAPVNRGVAAARVTTGAVVVDVAGTPEAGPTPVTIRVRSREVARALAGAGSTVSLPLGDPGPGWWVGEVSLDPDELRADDGRFVAWHTIPPARVRAAAGSGPFVAAALAALRAGGRVSDGPDISIDERPSAPTSIVLPPADPALTGEVNRALASRGATWSFGGPGTPGTLAAAVPDGLEGIAVRRRLRLEGADSGRVLARVNGEPWMVAVNGMVLLGSRLDTAWTDLPLLPSFVPFLDALVNRLARGEDPVVEREGAPGVVFTLVGPDTVGATIFGPDPRESDLSPAGANVIATALGAEIRAEGVIAAAAFAGAGRADATGLLLLIALFLALVELAVATIAR
jgi:hypothetical protein